MSEAKVVADFKKWMFKQYGETLYWYNITSTMYGDSGAFDIEVKIPSIDHTFHVEAKYAKSMKEAIRKLRPSQIGMSIKYLRAHIPGCLLWCNGCALCVGVEKWKEYSSFKELVNDVCTNFSTLLVYPL